MCLKVQEDTLKLANVQPRRWVRRPTPRMAPWEVGCASPQRGTAERMYRIQAGGTERSRSPLVKPTPTHMAWTGRQRSTVETTCPS